MARIKAVSGRVRTVASFERYEDAQAFVDRLSDEGFPVERLRIVGQDLQIVEQVTGRLNTVKAILGGAASGAPLGALLGLLFGFIFAPTGISLLATVLYWLVVGAIVGALIALLAYAFTRGRRDFTSTAGVTATRWDVLADESVADEAQRRAEHSGTSASASR